MAMQNHLGKYTKILFIFDFFCFMHFIYTWYHTCSLSFLGICTWKKSIFLKKNGFWERHKDWYSGLFGSPNTILIIVFRASCLFVFRVHISLWDVLSEGAEVDVFQENHAKSTKSYSCLSTKESPSFKWIGSRVLFYRPLNKLPPITCLSCFLWGKIPCFLQGKKAH